MNHSPNIEAAKRFFELVYAGDYDRAFSEYARPEFQFAVGSSSSEDLKVVIPWAGYAHCGREGYIALTNALFSEFDPLSFEPRRFSDTGDAVFVEGHFAFRHRVTAKIAESDWLVRFDMKDGRIAGGQFYEDTYAVAVARR
jgi:uncharacterized protein